MGFELFILLLRGPHVGRYTWFGYEGGWSARKGAKTKDVGMADAEKAEDTTQPDSKEKTVEAETGAPPAESAGDHDALSERRGT
jgi:hypothetical protein